MRTSGRDLQERCELKYRVGSPSHPAVLRSLKDRPKFARQAGALARVEAGVVVGIDSG